MSENPDSGRQAQRKRRGERGGFTLAEITVAVAVFAVMAGGVVFSLTRAKYLSWANRERLLALEAAQSVMEQVRGEDFRDAFACFNLDPTDDPAGKTSPGQFFAVPGLTVQQGDLDGFVGEVLFPGNGILLIENVNDRDWGLPRDIDLDKQIDGTDQGDDYVMLPVRVRVAWRGPRGNQQVELVSTLVDREGDPNN